MKQRVGTALVVVALSLLPYPGAALAAPDGSGRAADRLVVKFVDEARVRIRGAVLVSLEGADLEPVEAVLSRFGNPLPLRVLLRDEPAVDAARAAAEAHSGRPLPDLNGYVELTVAPSAALPSRMRCAA